MFFSVKRHYIKAKFLDQYLPFTPSPWRRRPHAQIATPGILRRHQQSEMGGEAHVGGSAVRGDAGVRSEQAEDDLGLEMRMMVTLYAQVQKSRSCTFFCIFRYAFMDVRMFVHASLYFC